MRHNVPTSVYLVYNRCGELLYVGASGAWYCRVANHISNRDWGLSVETIKLEHFPSRRLATEREKELILALNPRYNISKRLPRAKRLQPRSRYCIKCDQLLPRATSDSLCRYCYNDCAILADCS